MKLNDAQLGKPQILYKDTKSNIESLVGVAEGAVAFATDTNVMGSYDGSAWTWTSSLVETLRPLRRSWFGV